MLENFEPKPRCNTPTETHTVPPTLLALHKQSGPAAKAKLTKQLKQDTATQRVDQMQNVDWKISFTKTLNSARQLLVWAQWSWTRNPRLARRLKYDCDAHSNCLAKRTYIVVVIAHWNRIVWSNSQQLFYKWCFPVETIAKRNNDKNTENAISNTERDTTRHCTCQLKIHKHQIEQFLG